MQLGFVNVAVNCSCINVVRVVLYV